MQNNIGIENFNFLEDSLAPGLYIADQDSSKKLKGMGFNNPTYWYWLVKEVPFVEAGLKRVKQGEMKSNHNNYEEFTCSAPTKKQVISFLRNIK